MHGAARTGGAQVVRVEVSTHGGGTWNDARLLGDPVADAWRLWKHDCAVAAAPEDTVPMARATDSLGRTQRPSHHDDRCSYLIHHWLPVSVLIH